MEKTVQVTLNLDARKKNSILFKPSVDEEQPAVTGFYLMKHAFKELGDPNTIVLTIESK